MCVCVFIHVCLCMIERQADCISVCARKKEREKMRWKDCYSGSERMSELESENDFVKE